MSSTAKKEELKIKQAIVTSMLPRHIAIIMDGNGRWAKKHSFPRIRGHRQGIKAVRDTVRAARALGIEVLSMYAFSEENWKRPANEVSALMALLKKYLIVERDELMKNDIKLIATGSIEHLPENAKKELHKTMEMTSKNSSMILNLALSYSGRDEIVRAINRLLKDARSNGKNLDTIDRDTFAKYLDTKDLPDPDLLIRTSGELRISNFMLWQLAYTEIVVTEVLWPDFRKIDLYKAIVAFQKRERRFGLVSTQIPSDDFISNITY